MTTGIPRVTSSRTEVFDLEHGQKCLPLEDYPIEVEAATGALIDSQFPLICGGYYGDIFNPVGQCYALGQADPVATLITPRWHAESVLLNATHLLIVGGLGQGEVNFLKSSEIVSIGTDSRPGPDLPEPLDGHCFFKLNDSAAILVGGFNANGYSKKVYYLDLTTFLWTSGPNLAVARRYHACSAFTDESTGNQFLAVIGGRDENYLDSVEILDVQSQLWAAGKGSLKH